MTKLHYLVIRADGSARIVSRTPNLRADEIAYRLRIAMPPGWGSLASGEIKVTLPDPPGMPELIGEPERLSVP
jgi:hypothetical protein